MSYQVIARKWRPQTFEEVTGQEAITQTLRNAVEHDRLHHAYLFSGARGVGKTTTARLLAKSLNCQRHDRASAEPCPPGSEICSSCIEIAESRSIDVLEFDAASNTQVDKIRDLIIENINIAPARDRYKVFIIDEVHMLSTSSFNALLKTLEEPPPNVVFIMATTELHKVPDTILSRCQQFEFKTIATTRILDRLKLIAAEEKIDISEAALKEIARSGEGSMRDAQSAFDQVISFSGEKIEVEDVSNALGIADTRVMIDAIRGVAAKDSAALLKIVDDLIRRGHDLRNFCRDLQSFIRDMAVAKLTGSADLLESATVSPEELKKLAEDFSNADLLRFFNSLAKTEGELRLATQPRYILEIGLIKLIEIRRVEAIEDLIRRLGELESLIRNADMPHKSDSAVATSMPPSSPVQEKKTLISEKRFAPPDDIPFPVSSAEGISSETPPPKEPEPAFVKEPPRQKTAFEIPADLPVRLPPISAEDLEHVEDSWLDAAYERRLSLEGDDLLYMPAVAIPTELGLGVAVERLAARTASAAASNGYSINIDLSPIAPDTEDPGELPILSEAPTEDELIAYAQKHPAVKRAMRIFRGKITSVSKK
jgi:DNA polymerase-3 subunit gamma/tau